MPFYDTHVTFWRASIPDDELIPIVPPRGEDAANIVWSLRTAMYGAGKALQLLQSYMHEVFARIGYNCRAVSHQEHISGSSQTIAAPRESDISVEDEAVDIDTSDQAPLDNIDIKLPGYNGIVQPLTEAVFLKWRIVYISIFGCEWMENPKPILSAIENRPEEGSKPPASPARRRTGRHQSDDLNELTGDDVLSQAGSVSRSP